MMSLSADGNACLLKVPEETTRALVALISDPMTSWTSTEVAVATLTGG
jgi:hypothetical protein